MIRSARSMTSSMGSVQAFVERYFQPPSAATKTITPASIRCATRQAPARAAPLEIPANTDTSAARRRRVLQRLAGAHDALAVEQLITAPVLVDRGDVAVLEAAQPLHLLPRRGLDGVDLHVRLVFLEVPPAAHERAGGAQAGHEVGDVGAVGEDLRAGRLVVRPRVCLVGVLAQVRPLGMFGGEALGSAHRPVGALGTRRVDDLGAVDGQQVAPLAGDVLG